MEADNVAKPQYGQPIFRRAVPRPQSPSAQPNERKSPQSQRQVRPDPADGASESRYLKRHAELKTPMLVTLKSGTVIRGRIQWTDTYSIKFEREPAEGNVLIYKSSIEYIQRDTGGRQRGN